MNEQSAMPGRGTGQLEPQAVKLLVQILAHLRQNPRMWPQLYQIAVRAGIPKPILPPPDAPLNVLAQFARKLVAFLRAYGVGSAPPTQQQAPMRQMQPGPALGMAYGGPVLDVTTASDRPAMGMAYGGRVDTIPAMMRPGEYVATPEAIRLDPSLDDRISAANIAANGMEGPTLLAAGPTAGTQRIHIELDPDLYGTKAALAAEGGGYKTGSDVRIRPPSDEQLRRHIQKSMEEGKRNQRRKGK